MANLKISQLPSVSASSNGDLYPLVQAGVTSSITFTNLQTSIVSSIIPGQLPTITLTGEITGSASGGTIPTLIAATSNSTLTTLSALTTASALHSVGTITSGTWNGTTIAIVHGGTGQTTKLDAFDALSPLITTGDTLYFNGTHNVNLSIGSTGQILSVVGGEPTWADPATNGTVTSVSVVNTNGFTGTVATATTTPAITIETTLTTPVLAGNGTALIAATTTGTGSTVVLNTSPTLVTPALGTPSAIVLTNATGLPATTGIAGILPVPNGGTGTATGSITGTTALTFTAGGTNQNVNLNPSGTGYTLSSGNIGVGTSTPAYLLDVVANSGPYIDPNTTGVVYAARIMNNSSGVFAGGLEIVGGTSETLNSPILTVGDGTGKKYFEIASGGTTQFLNVETLVLNGGNSYGNTTKFVVENTSDFGSAAAQFTAANSDGNFNLGIIASGVSDNAYITNTTATGAITFGTNNVEVMRITSGGDVGIGTTAPQELLDVAGNVRLQHLRGSTAAPTIAAGAGAGASPTVSITGTDTAGVISITTGTGSASSSLLATITFNIPYTAGPYVILTPGNALTSSHAAPTSVYVHDTSDSTFAIYSVTALSDTSTYQWYYHVIQ